MTQNLSEEQFANHMRERRGERPTMNREMKVRTARSPVDAKTFILPWQMYAEAAARHPDVLWQSKVVRHGEGVSMRYTAERDIPWEELTAARTEYRLEWVEPTSVTVDYVEKYLRQHPGIYELSGLQAATARSGEQVFELRYYGPRKLTKSELVW